MLERYLAKLERLVDSNHYAQVRNAYRQVFAWQELEELPYVWRTLPPVGDCDWPVFEYNDTFVNREKMLLAQLAGPFFHLQTQDYLPLAIRANYGTVILPSILGAEYQLTETSLPWCHHLADRDAIGRVIDAGVPDPSSGLGQTCFETAKYFIEKLAPYPNLARETTIYHPDLQGPFDVAHLLWGPDIFLALYDCPETVHQLLELVVETYIAWLHKWKALVGEGNEFTAHWSIMMRGGAMLRDDTPVMLSTAQYEEFVKPYDQRILDEFGGCIHFCGSGKPFIESMVSSKDLYGLHMSQPELNDLDSFWRLCQENHLVVLEMREEYVPKAIKRGVTLSRQGRSSSVG